MNQLNPQHLTVRPFARVAQADALPGHCIRCPRNADLVDLGAPGIPNFGVVYVCTVCLGDLMNQMKVIGFEQHQAAIAAHVEQREQLEQRLAAAIDAKNAPVEFITDKLEGFSNAVDSAARDLIAGLGSYSAPRDPGGDRVAAEAESSDEQGNTELPLDAPLVVDPEPERVADAPARRDPAVLGVDDGEALVAALLGTDAVPAARASADAGAGDGDVRLSESGNVLDELYDADPR